MPLDARQASARHRPVPPMPRPATGSSTPRVGRPGASHLPFSGLPRRSCRPHLARLPASLSHSLPRLSLTRVRRALALLPRRRRPPWPSPAPPSRVEPLLAPQRSRRTPWPPPPPSLPWSSLLQPPSARTNPPTSFPALHRCSPTCSPPPSLAGAPLCATAMAVGPRPPRTARLWPSSTDSRPRGAPPRRPHPPRPLPRPPLANPSSERARHRGSNCCTAAGALPTTSDPGSCIKPALGDALVLPYHFPAAGMASPCQNRAPEHLLGSQFT